MLIDNNLMLVNFIIDKNIYIWINDCFLSGKWNFIAHKVLYEEPINLGSSFRVLQMFFHHYICLLIFAHFKDVFIKNNKAFFS